jgi:hypothetical protein
MKIRIEPKRIDRETNHVDTVSFSDAEFFGIYVERYDEEFDEHYWRWEFDRDTLDEAYRAALALGLGDPTVRAA